MCFFMNFILFPVALSRRRSENINDKETNKAIRQIVKKHSRFYTEKSRNISGGQLNLVIELAVQDGSQLTGELSSVRSIHSVSLLSHDGEVTF